MLKKLILNDVRQNKLLSAATVFFMTISATLLVLTALLFTELLGAIGGLMEKAAVPDLMQMHAGEVDEEALARFVRAQPDVQRWQVCRFLNLDNSQLLLGEHNMVDSTQDNGLTVQSEQFDFLLGMDGALPEVSPGEVYVPICYREKYGLSLGEKMTIGDEALTIAGFLRDAQMNAMMASSKRFLVNQEDYDRLRGQGQEESLIEFLVRDGANVSALQTAYAGQGLPSNGPAITRPLIRMINALSDGMMIFVIFLVGIVVLLISMLCIHFILSLQMERERKEAGMLKALGIARRDIRHIYFTKYLLFSTCGALLGLGLALLAQGPLSAQLRVLYGAAEQGVPMVLAAGFAEVLAEGLILLSIRHSLRKTGKLPAVDALFHPGKQGRGWTKSILTGAVMAACTFLILMPNHLYNTLSAPSFVTYMGIGSGELRIDLRQREDISAGTKRIAAGLEEDTQVEQYTFSYPALLSDGSRVNLTVEAGDHLVFPVSYSEGIAPKKENEIALSALNAKELGLALGDSVQMAVDGAERDFTVCGIYSDITNGGKTAKICGQETQTPVIWSVIYVSLVPGADREAWMAQYRDMGADVVRIADYVQDTYAQTLSQLDLASRVVMGVGILVILVVLGLFSRLIVERSRYTISLHKALGRTDGECRQAHFIRGMAPAMAGAAAGLLLGCFGGESLCGAVLNSLGADGFRFVIDPAQTLIGIPLLALAAAACAVWVGTAGISAIKAYECCMGKE